MAKTSIFGLEFGDDDEDEEYARSRTIKTTQEIEIPQEELMQRLGIKEQPTYIQYDFKRKVLVIKVVK